MRRLETGVVQCPDDWPGIFIRGDRALHFAMVIKSISARAGLLDPIEKGVLEEMTALFFSCHNQTVHDVQRIKRDEA